MEHYLDASKTLPQNISKKIDRCQRCGDEGEHPWERMDPLTSQTTLPPSQPTMPAIHKTSLWYSFLLAFKDCHHNLLLLLTPVRLAGNGIHTSNQDYDDSTLSIMLLMWCIHD